MADILSCGHPPTPALNTPGWVALPPNNRHVCYPCADDWQRERMKTEMRIGAYLSGDCKELRTWTGGKLADVTRLMVRRGRYRKGPRAGEPWARYYWRASAAGRHWTGVSEGPNMVTIMRAAKAPRGVQ